jgi:uncharacterized RDD family membrane protein YckC
MESETRVSVRRVFAHWIDGVIIALVAWPLSLGLHSLVDGWSFTLAAVLVTLVYFVALQARDGRTLGKRMCGLRVVGADGRTPDVAALVKRTVPLFVEWTGLFAWLGILSSRYRQRWGDRWAHTYVVDD